MELITAWEKEQGALESWTPARSPLCRRSIFLPALQCENSLSGGSGREQVSWREQVLGLQRCQGVSMEGFGGDMPSAAGTLLPQRAE